MKRTSQTVNILLCLFLTGVTTHVNAEQAYITDKVVIDIHTLQNEEGHVVTRLNSGAPVEILSTDGDYARIKTPTNKTGWIHNKYLNREKPVSIEYLQLQGKYKQLTKDLKAAQEKADKTTELEKSAKAASYTKNQLNKKIKEIRSLKKALEEKSQKLGQAGQKIKELETSINDQKKSPPQAQKVAHATEPVSFPIPNDTAQTGDFNGIFKLDQGPFKVPFVWAAVAMAFTLVIGIVIGMKWLDYRIRKRHGGVRLY